MRFGTVFDCTYCLHYISLPNLPLSTPECYVGHPISVATVDSCVSSTIEPRGVLALLVVAGGSVKDPLGPVVEASHLQGRQLKPQAAKPMDSYGRVCHMLYMSQGVEHVVTMLLYIILIGLTSHSEIDHDRVSRVANEFQEQIHMVMQAGCRLERR